MAAVIDEKELERIFDRFYQSNDNSTGGSGIGLHLAKMITQLPTEPTSSRASTAIETGDAEVTRSSSESCRKAHTNGSVNATLPQTVSTSMITKLAGPLPRGPNISAVICMTRPAPRKVVGWLAPHNFYNDA